MSPELNFYPKPVPLVFRTARRGELYILETPHKVLLIHEVAVLCRVAESTVRRWVAESRAGRGDFPLPISQPGRKLLWRASDIETFLSRSNALPPDNVVSPAKQMRRETQDFKNRQELASKTLAQHRAGMK